MKSKEKIQSCKIWGVNRKIRKEEKILKYKKIDLEKNKIVGEGDSRAAVQVAHQVVHLQVVQVSLPKTEKIKSRLEVKILSIGIKVNNQNKKIEIEIIRLIGIRNPFKQKNIRSKDNEVAKKTTMIEVNNIENQREFLVNNNNLMNKRIEFKLKKNMKRKIEIDRMIKLKKSPNKSIKVRQVLALKFRSKAYKRKDRDWNRNFKIKKKDIIKNKNSQTLKK